MKRAIAFTRSVIVALAAMIALPTVAQTVIIHAGSVVTDADATPTGPATITVTDGKIVSIDEGFLPTPDGATMVHLPDHTLVPGLIDLHTHLSGDPSGEFWRAATTPPEYSVLVAAKNARITALAGFTTVRDLGSRTDQVTQMLRRATAEGMVPGPRVVTSARTIAIVGGHGDTNGFRRGVGEILGSDFTCTGPVACAEMVRTASKFGADLIKITATGGVLSQQGRGLEAHFSDAEMKAIVDTARSLGLKVAAHAHGARGIEAAARAGVQTIEHGTYIDEQAAKVMRENGTILVPTLMAFQGIKENLGKGFYTPVVEEKVRAVGPFAESIVERARQLGVKLAFGTDAGVFPHSQNARELALMRKGGMSNREALASATTVAAEVLGLEDEIGRLAPGFSADIVAVTGNPLDDVAVMESVDWVMVRGRVVE
ncbi:metal-dependent hydrolase family protein [Parerythrobacter jejuensis]|uniref:Amidohydrolase family protein n=1 Tax=Parerythrobacter jejuensis TaxID=795812 RepID=A0A845ALR1_9SPHN|nr:amidohydrolase family protein [Parerythrobacter jejuensis]MXP30357.1 amidohydrolase family protein [Parerythrobacter jejuensis]MXP33117.1 amidohydrolase family protein [Parerythrobacter jejuensis]